MSFELLPNENNPNPIPFIVKKELIEPTLSIRPLFQDFINRIDNYETNYFNCHAIVWYNQIVLYCLPKSTDETISCGTTYVIWRHLINNIRMQERALKQYFIKSLFT